MPASLLFVHSPLVGPSSWRDVADLAVAAGLHAEVAELTGVAVTTQPGWRFCVAAAMNAAAGLTDVVIVGHSGAGVLLPAIADRLGDRCVGSVFVDAVVPLESGVHETPPAMVAMLDEQTVNGRLAPWLSWWPADVVAELLPDPAARARLIEDMPQLPRAFYDDAVPLPESWSSKPNGYLQLSSAYDADRQQGAERGWPIRRIDGSHLSIVTSPDVVFDSITSLVDELTA